MYFCVMLGTCCREAVQTLRWFHKVIEPPWLSACFWCCHEVKIDLITDIFAHFIFFLIFYICVISFFCDFYSIMILSYSVYEELITTGSSLVVCWRIAKIREMMTDCHQWISSSTLPSSVFWGWGMTDAMYARPPWVRYRLQSALSWNFATNYMGQTAKDGAWW